MYRSVGFCASSVREWNDKSSSFYVAVYVETCGTRLAISLMIMLQRTTVQCSGGAMKMKTVSLAILSLWRLLWLGVALSVYPTWVGAYRKEGTDPVSEFINTSIQQVKDSFHQQMGLKFEEGTNESLHF